VRGYKIIHIVKNKNVQRNEEDLVTRPSQFSTYGESLPSNPFFETLNMGENIIYTKVYDSHFFTEEFIQKYLLDNKIDLIELIFIFDDCQWKTMVSNFKNLNIILSGGSTVSRHILSPVQINLARFILGSEDLKNSHQISKDSFKIHKQLHNSYRLKNFVKDKKIWLIREYFKFNQAYSLQRHNSLILKLYHIYINSPYLIDFILYMIIYSEKHYYKNDHLLVCKFLSDLIDSETAVFFIEGPLIKNQHFYRDIQAYESKFFPVNLRKNKLEHLLIEIKLFNETLIKKDGLKWQIKPETVQKQLDIELKYQDKNIKFLEEREKKIKQEGEKEFKEYMKKIKRN